MLLGCLLTGIRGNAQQPYVVKTTDGTALTFYYDTLKTGRAGTAYEIQPFTSPKAPWCDSLVTTVTFDASFKTYKPMDTSRWFYWMTGLKTINGISNLNTSAVKSMDMMFENCKSLTTLDLSSWSTSAVTDMAGMFAYCSSLKDLKLTGFDVSHVRYMSNMFYGCQSLTALDVSVWDVSQVRDMDKMFGYCTSLKTLDVSHWDTDNVEDVRGMFEYCSQLSTLDVSNWDMGNVQDAGAINNPVMQDMFRGCSRLTSLDLSKWDVHQVTNMSNMFNGCSSLTTVGDLSGWNTASISNISGMFASCTSLRTLNVRNWNTSHVRSLTEFLQNVGTYTRPLLLDIDSTFSFYVKGAVTEHQGVLSYTWQGGIIASGPYVYAIQSPDSTTLTFYYDDGKFSREGKVYEVKASYSWDVKPTWITSKKITHVVIDPSFHGFKPTDTFAWFYGMSSVVSFSGLGNINTSQVKNMNYLFSGCTSLETIDVSQLDVSHATYLSCLFSDDTKLAHITGLSNWDVSHASYLSNMFENCSSLTSVADLANWQLTKAVSLGRMFAGCSSISSFDDIAYWNVGNVTSLKEIFSDCTSLTHFDLSHWHIGNSTDMTGMFQNSSLSSIDLSHNDIEKLSSSMFKSCTRLEAVVFPKGLKSIGAYRTAGLIDPGNTFYGCSSLKEINLPEGLTFIGYQSFSGCTSIEKVILPNSITTLGNYAFSNCTSLKEINIPNGVTNLSGVFQNCRSLLAVKIPNSVVRFGDFLAGQTFQNCVSLKHVTLPSNIEYLGLFPFEGTHITSITLPANVNSYPDLSGMKQLKEIFIMGDAMFKSFSSGDGLRNDSNLTVYVKKSLYDKIKSTYPNTVWKQQNISLGYLIPVEMTSHYKSICRDFDVDLKSNVPAENQIEAALPVSVNDERKAVAMRTIDYVPSRTRANLMTTDSTRYKGLDNYVGAILYGEPGNTYYYTIGEDDYTKGDAQKTIEDVLISGTKASAMSIDNRYSDIKEQEDYPDFDNGFTETSDIKLVGANDERYTGPESENASGIVYNNYGLKDGAFHIYGSSGYTPFNRAYLSIAQDIPAAKAFSFNIEFEDGTGTVTHVTSLQDMIRELDNSTYDLQGRKVTPGYKGIVIGHGRKYLQR